MDVRIGIAQSGQIIEIELPEDADRGELKRQIEATLKGEAAVLWVTDRKGKETGVAGERIAFVELSEADAERRIGFGA